MNELALFAGAGGGILGGQLLGWETVCAVEIDPYAASVLAARQNDGCLPPFPIWDDVTTFDGRPWRGVVDVVSGGFPCQDISSAGKGIGITGARSGLWKQMLRIISEVLPRFVFVENSPMLVGRGLITLLADFAALGYDVRWGIVGAHHAGAPHKRDRIWICAWLPDTDSAGCEKLDTAAITTKQSQPAWVFNPLAVADTSRDEQGRQEQWAERERTGSSGEPGNDADALRGGREASREIRPGKSDSIRLLATVADSKTLGRSESGLPLREEKKLAGPRECDPSVANAAGDGCGQVEQPISGRAEAEGPASAPSDCGFAGRGGWWLAEPDVGRVAHGVAARVDRLRCLGNGQVSGVVPIAWHFLKPF